LTNHAVCDNFFNCIGYLHLNTRKGFSGFPMDNLRKIMINLLGLKVFTLVLCVLFIATAASSQELFLCKNPIIEEPINMEQIKELKKTPLHYFRPGERIAAIFVFRPDGRERYIEFKWIREMAGRAIKEKNYLHPILPGNAGFDYVSYSWIFFESSFSHKIFGFKFAGPWYVQVFVDGQKKAEENFFIDSD